MSQQNQDTNQTLIVRRTLDTIEFDYNGQEIFLNTGDEDDASTVVIDLLQQLGFNIQIN
tara:strand:- start:265 stop:441 length:177 start_codon:yes stop_codon:yes gene_type:complete